RTTLGSPVTGSADATVLTIPLTVDTPNTRVHIVVHCNLAAGVGTTPIVASSIAGVISRGTSFNPDGGWQHATFDVPPMSVLSEGSYNIHLDVSGSSGSWQLEYQVLVWLVTSG